MARAGETVEITDTVASATRRAHGTTGGAGRWSGRRSLLIERHQHAVDGLVLRIFFRVVDQLGECFAEFSCRGRAEAQVTQCQVVVGGERSSSWATAANIAAVPAAWGSATSMRRAVRW